MSMNPTMEVTGLPGGHVQLRLHDGEEEFSATMDSNAVVEVTSALLEQSLLAPAGAIGGLDGSVTVGSTSVSDAGEHALIALGPEANLHMRWEQVDVLAAQLLAALVARRASKH